MTQRNPLFESVLVTGCGGDVAIGVARIIRDAGLARRVFGTEIHDAHPGRLLYDGVDRIPRATDPAYGSELERIVCARGVGAVVPTSEAELARLLAAGTRNIGDALLLMPSPRALEVGLDKLTTATFLTARGLSSPWTQLVADGPPPELPCVVKPRRSQGSKGVAVIGQTELDDCLARRRDDIFQELLVPHDEEFTCGLYRSREGETRTIAFRRVLRGGLTGHGVVVDEPVIQRYLCEIAAVLELQGSINVQLRRTDKGPKAFEINPRFSSTVVFRHKLGFHDVCWSLMEAASVALPPYAPPAAGTRILRGSFEYILEPD